ncbi:Transmembrane protein of unknown function [Actinomadura madurae]|uniref:DUF3566 domain-containing protein n=1 Tax=Actinomadura madurae TaxID=1993 RepID=A0A1I5WXS8_9ACTN|nr:DUF3566 domain-containing protein [Actinomadura madurae]SFQ24448.1 Transmembrane protein of unknown function [Actinomadura madurae]
MSTEPGNDQDGPGTGKKDEAPAKQAASKRKPSAGKPAAAKPGGSEPGAKPSGGKPAAKPGRTVAAASAKSSRDETTVDIESDKSGSGAEETRTDLAHLGDEPDTPEIAPVKDTAEPPKDGKPKAESTPSSPAPPATGKPAASPAASTPAASASGPAGWAKPAEPSGSVSTGRTDKPAKPFKSAGADSGNASSGSNSGGGLRGFAGTVLKDRPSTSVAPANSAAAKAANGKPARKAQLQLSRLEPWSVMKFSFVMSLVCFVVLLVAVIVLYAILSGLGVFDAISDTINSLTKEQGETSSSVDAGNWFSFFRVFGYTVLVGALNVLLITALSTVGSVIYNLAADLVGGVEVTLKEAE